MTVKFNPPGRSRRTAPAIFDRDRHVSTRSVSGSFTACVRPVWTMKGMSVVLRQQSQFCSRLERQFRVGLARSPSTRIRTIDAARSILRKCHPNGRFARWRALGQNLPTLGYLRWRGNYFHFRFISQAANERRATFRRVFASPKPTLPVPKVRPSSQPTLFQFRGMRLIIRITCLQACLCNTEPKREKSICLTNYRFTPSLAGQPARPAIS